MHETGGAPKLLPELQTALRDAYETCADWRLGSCRSTGATEAKVMQHLLKDDTQVYKQFVENESFKRFVGDMVYAITSP